MVDFKALAERAATVQVAGEDVHLRLPGPEMDEHLLAFIEAGKPGKGGKPDQSPAEGAAAMRELTAQALNATVVDTTADLDTWRAIARAHPSALPEGMDKLAEAALRLCGLDTDMPDGGTDNVAEADAAMGNSPTS